MHIKSPLAHDISTIAFIQQFRKNQPRLRRQEQNADSSLSYSDFD